MPTERQPPEALLSARRALEELPFVKILEDLQWYDKVSKWGFQCRIKINHIPASLIPALTYWYVIIEPAYPWGQIDIYPAKKGGIFNTFHHQNLNSEGNPDLPWRKGNICVQTSLRLFCQRGYDQEPMSNETRLSWHLLRAYEWLSAASQNKLVQPGDPFELPYVPRLPNRLIGFIEDSFSYSTFWKVKVGSYGYATLIQDQQNNGHQVIKSFHDPSYLELRRYRYGSNIDKFWQLSETALWIKLEAVPVLQPWQIPMTFGELQAVLNLKGIDLKSLILQLSHRIRDGRRHLMLLGFPIPDKVGEAEVLLHWFGFLLPKLTSGNIKGFRPREVNFRRQDELRVFKDDAEIDWVKTENWHANEIGSRSRFSPSIRKAKISIIGVGALGSCVANLLVRSGINNPLLIDGDEIEIGNLCRHTAKLLNVGESKVRAVKSSLNSISPHARVTCIQKNFSELDDQEKKYIIKQDVIFDCTASDRLISELAQFELPEERLFISASLGLYAKRLFYFAFHGRHFPQDLLMKSVAPFISRELDEYNGFELPREGIGCWHPLFPARIDDIWLMASLVVKLFEHDYLVQPKNSVFRVYEQQFRDGLPMGIQNIHEAHYT